MYKNHQIVMLPTKEASNLMLTQSGKLCYPETQEAYNFVRAHGNVTDQNLYILSDDKIKEGDWVICLSDIEGNKYHKVKMGDKQYISPLRQRNKNDTCLNCKKIIATTDPTCRIGCPTPRPHESFIHSFIEQYNLGSAVANVDVEYEYNEDRIVDGKDIGDYKISINSNNIITIKLIKENYTSLEVAGIIRLFENTYHNDRFKLNLDMTDRSLFVGEFIEKHL